MSGAYFFSNPHPSFCLQPVVKVMVATKCEEHNYHTVFQNSHKFDMFHGKTHLQVKTENFLDNVS